MIGIMISLMTISYFANRRIKEKKPHAGFKTIKGRVS